MLTGRTLDFIFLCEGEDVVVLLWWLRRRRAAAAAAASFDDPTLTFVIQKLPNRESPLDTPLAIFKSHTKPHKTTQWFSSFFPNFFNNQVLLATPEKPSRQSLFSSVEYPKYCNNYEEEGAWRSKASRDGGGERGTSFELRTQCFISPPPPRGFVFCTHISSHLPTCTCTSAKSKGSNFSLYLCNSKSCTSCHIPLQQQQQQFSCNSFAPTFQYLCNSKAATLLYICSSSSSKAPNFPLPLQQQHSSNLPTKPTKKVFSNSQIMLKNLNSKVQILEQILWSKVQICAQNLLKWETGYLLNKPLIFFEKQLGFASSLHSERVYFFNCQFWSFSCLSLLLLLLLLLWGWCVIMIIIPFSFIYSMLSFFS